MNLMQMQQARADAKARANAIHALATAENRLLSSEELVRFNAETETVKNLDANIAVAKSRQDEERTAGIVGVVEVGQNLAENKPWDSLGEQLKAVKVHAASQGRISDPRLNAALGQNETIDAEGGFNIAPEFASGLLTRAFNAGILASSCRKRPMSSSRLVINGIDDSSRATGGRFGGLAVYRIAEAALYTKAMMKFRRVELNANKLIGLYYATDEILEDAPALQAEINDQFPLAFGWQLDNEVLNGTGVGQFLGVYNSGVAFVVPKDSGQAANTYSTQNFINMKARLAPQSRGKAKWYVGPDFEGAVSQLTLGTGTAVELLYKQPGTMANPGPNGKILGMEVLVVEQTAPLSSQGDVLLADLDCYVIGERSGLQMASSIHVQFLTGEQAFRWTMRNDGQPLWDKPLTLNNSAQKVSPFVALGAR